jgi:hypothetical protein
MTMIIERFKTKKALKEAIARGDQVEIIDPALMPEWRKYGSHFEISILPLGEAIVVTNHPRRTWFAELRAVWDRNLGRKVIKVT